ncbi:MAG: ATP-binding protein [Paracoccaceae bacterium]
MANDLSAAPAERAAFRFRAELGEVRSVLRRAVARFARQITAEDAGALELTLAEVLNNIVEHAYAGQPGGPISLTIWREPARLGCLVEDRGQAMPGLAPPDPPLAAIAGQAGDLPEGGWGWALIRAMTEDLAYDRRQGVNRLRFGVPLAVAV